MRYAPHGYRRKQCVTTTATENVARVVSSVTVNWGVNRQVLPVNVNDRGRTVVTPGQRHRQQAPNGPVWQNRNWRPLTSTFNNHIRSNGTLVPTIGPGRQVITAFSRRREYGSQYRPGHVAIISGWFRKRHHRNIRLPFMLVWCHATYGMHVYGAYGIIGVVPSHP